MALNIPYILRILTTISLYVILGMGLNVSLGLAGLLDMGYVGFYAVGAYTYALLSSPQLGIHLPLAVSFPAAIFASMILSLVIGIPTLRLHGDYLAIVTMGFAEIVRILLVNLDRPVNITNGPNGIIRVDPIAIGPLKVTTPQAKLMVMVSVAALAYLAYVRLGRSRLGLKWKALKDDPIAAGAMGVDTSFHRVLAFAVGSIFASTAGVLFASWQGAVFPQNFTMNELIVLYCMVVLGGAGNPLGTVTGAVTLVILPEALRGYSVYRMLVYGSLLVVAMIYRPGGFLPGGPPATSLRKKPGPPFSGGTRNAIRPPASQGTKPHGATGSTGPSPILSAKDITVRFGGVTALSDVSIDLYKGEVLSIIGPNGAGKTTLVNVLTGITRPSQGSVFFEGKPVGGLKPHRLHRLGISRTFQNNRLFGSLTVAENLAVPGEAAASEGEIGDLSTLSNRKAKDLSYGHRKALELSRAMVGNPKVVILDEPAAGVNPQDMDRLSGRVKAMKEAGYSVLLIEHRMPLVMSVSDRVIVLDQGKILSEGIPSQVIEDPRVAEVYLGSGSRHGEAPETAGREAIDRASRPVEPGFELPAPIRESLPPAGNYPTDARTQDTPFLELQDLHAGYGPVKVLHGVSLAVRRSSVVCILGNNGAGKSTTLKAVLGMAGIDSGKVLLDGRDITGKGPETLAAMGIAAVPEGRRLFGSMTVAENLAMGARPGDGREGVALSKDRVLNLFPALKERLRQKAGTLSGGEQQMLAIGRALMSRPSLLLLDEPSMGLSPAMVLRILGVLRELAASGLTVLMVEQNVGVAESLSDTAYVLENGRITMSGPIEELASSSLRRAYLGHAGAKS
jgi:branched-chain amino acid transport system ATP-binding protein